MTDGEPRQDRERRYIAEYMAQAFPLGNYQLNVPLGPIPDDIISQYGLTAGAKLFHPQRPRIDAVAWTDKFFWLVEAKIREPRDAIGSLLVYKGLADKTPDLPYHDKQPFVTRLVIPWSLSWVDVAAREYGMQVVVFLPPWAEDYVRSRQEYFTKSYRDARDEKERLRRSFGLE